MADLDLVRKIEVRTGRSFVEVTAEEFRGTKDKPFRNQYAYVLSDEDEVVGLSLGTFYEISRWMRFRSSQPYICIKLRCPVLIFSPRSKN